MFWEWAWSLNPEAVRGEADGCLNHIVNLDTFDFNRHADISTPLRTPRPAKLYFLDFPRHGAFYLHMWGAIEQTVRWTTRSNWRQLAGRKVRLRIRLRNADLYAFWTAKEK
jgi:hypothetical protein